ncbi:mRNA interferase YafQ [Ferrovum myxofaciens]|jgi:hypothetical protein|uniref:mRNA interferase YafQ n=1 Tax=Ferrovum myxofaciens TaxID=416213 RepID=A0A149VV98_9PROT|nr:mRNA interferase YafQ [Ferrovum myxofaciens]
MRTPSYAGQFTRDVKLAKKRKKDLSKLRTLQCSRGKNTGPSCYFNLSWIQAPIADVQTVS